MFHSRLQITCDPAYAEILMAEIAEAGFETFLETATGFEAYVELENFDKEQLEFIKEKYSRQTPIAFYHDRIEKRNWNEEWEKGYEPIVVEDKCLIRADFHQPNEKYLYELIITPKMSFGTGHHETTYLMIKNQMDIDHRQKRVMDAGCGTAILSIMASKLGAKAVEAFDIDEWSVTNGRENIAANNCKNINNQQGKLEELNIPGQFDLILANINKNVLLEEIRLYKKYLGPAALMLLSGFYVEDIPDILLEGSRNGLMELKRDVRGNWAALVLVTGK